MKAAYFFPCAVLAFAAIGCSTTDNCLLTRPQSNAWNADPKVPAIVRAPEGHVLLGHVVGRGVATFTLQADANDPNRLAWVASRDEGGDLLDDDGNVVGHHEGNSWAMRDGGQVSADLIAKVPQHNRSPLALYQAASHEGGGLMGSAEFVEQLHTVGGPPLAARGAVGTEFRAEYSADYYFYGAVASQTRRAAMGG